MATSGLGLWTCDSNGYRWTTTVDCLLKRLQMDHGSGLVTQMAKDGPQQWTGDSNGYRLTMAVDW